MTLPWGLWGLWVLKTTAFVIIGPIIMWAFVAPTLRYLRKINLISRRTR